MIEGYNKVLQALLGTLLTYGLTAAGSAMIYFLNKTNRVVLDLSLGFSAGVMIAASFWSLLAPAIELVQSTDDYGSFGILIVAFGFTVGSTCVYLTDLAMVRFDIDPTSLMMIGISRNDRKDDVEMNQEVSHESSQKMLNDNVNSMNESHTNEQARQNSWKRIFLLIIAITIHNIPEGLAVGISFGAIGSTEKATFEAARNLAIGIGLQNFPEGLAVSLPLYANGCSLLKSIFYGQLSGLVEPFFGILGAYAVGISKQLLPFGLSFAAGAMIHIVASDILPEAHSCGNGKIATICCIAGFVLMMCLDVILG